MTRQNFTRERNLLKNQMEILTLNMSQRKEQSIISEFDV